jgi:hypothetical protein
VGEEAVIARRIIASEGIILQSMGNGIPFLFEIAGVQSMLQD